MAPPLGFMGAILDVDLTSSTHRVRELTQDMADQWLGGTGLGAHLLWEERAFAADPLGPDNVMVMAAGPFAGTSVPLSNRFGVCARSPLTGVWGEAECGGHWANDLKKSGFDALVLRGRAERPVYLWIHDGQVELRDASHLWGKDTFETHDRVREEVGLGRATRARSRRGVYRARPARSSSASLPSWSTAKTDVRLAAPVWARSWAPRTSKPLPCAAPSRCAWPMKLGSTTT